MVDRQTTIEGSLLAFCRGEWNDDDDELVRSLSFDAVSNKRQTDHELDYTRSPEGPIPGFSKGKPGCDDRIRL